MCLRDLNLTHLDQRFYLLEKEGKIEPFCLSLTASTIAQTKLESVLSWSYFRQYM